MQAKFFLGFLLLFLCQPNHESSANEFYRWLDEKGTIHFADNLHSVPEPYRKGSREAQAPPTREQPSPTSDAGTIKPSHLQRYVVPLTWEAGRLLVDARLNDRIPVRFIIDTGANMTMIPASVASRLGFEKKNALSIDIRGVGGVLEGRLIEVDGLKVGEAAVRNVDMIVVEDSLGGTALLGADFLSRFQMEIDFNRGHMVLRSGEGPYDGYPAQWWHEKFRLYDRLKRAYERRISQNKNHMAAFGASAEGRHPEVRYSWGIDRLRPVVDEINEYQNYLSILAKKLSALQNRANRAALPQTFRQFPLTDAF